MFGVISDKVGGRPGGYTCIIKLPRRAGDAADMAMIEPVAFNEIYGKDAEAADVKKPRRSRRGSGAAKTTEATPVASATTEAPAAEATETAE